MATTETYQWSRKYMGFYLDENDPINGNEHDLQITNRMLFMDMLRYPSIKLSFFDGNRVYFIANSELIVGNKSSIQINGYFFF
jgi:hypothetical protein